jgi:hypothetical protein
VVARERFELSSRAPEAPMLDRYTTGLQKTETWFKIINFDVMPLQGFCFFNIHLRFDLLKEEFTNLLARVLC